MNIGVDEKSQYVSKNYEKRTQAVKGQTINKFRYLSID